MDIVGPNVKDANEQKYSCKKRKQRNAGEPPISYQLYLGWNTTKLPYLVISLQTTSTLMSFFSTRIRPYWADIEGRTTNTRTPQFKKWIREVGSFVAFSYQGFWKNFEIWLILISSKIRKSRWKCGGSLRNHTNFVSLRMPFWAPSISLKKLLKEAYLQSRIKFLSTSDIQPVSI